MHELNEAWINGVERDDENWFILRLRWAEIDHVLMIGVIKVRALSRKIDRASRFTR